VKNPDFDDLISRKAKVTQSNFYSTESTSSPPIKIYPDILI